MFSILPLLFTYVAAARKLFNPFQEFNLFLDNLPDLIHRAILISGSALSPWAIQRDPLSVKKKVAADTGCHGDLLEDDLAPCLRKKSIAELLAIKLDSPR